MSWPLPGSKKTSSPGHCTFPAASAGALKASRIAVAVARRGKLLDLLMAVLSPWFFVRHVSAVASHSSAARQYSAVCATFVAHRETKPDCDQLTEPRAPMGSESL